MTTSPAVTVSSRAPLRRAAALMEGRSVGSLVVTSSNGKVASGKVSAVLTAHHAAELTR